MDTLTEAADQSGPCLIPPIEMWDVQAARWCGDGSVLEPIGAPGQYLLASPPFDLEPGREYAFVLDMDLHGDSVIVFGLLGTESGKWIEQRAVVGDGPHPCSLGVAVERPTSVWLCLADGRQDDSSPTRVSNLSLEVLERGEDEPPIPLSKIVPPPGRWTVKNAAWDVDRVCLESIGAPGTYLLASPPFELKPGHEYVFSLDIDIHDDSAVVFGLVDVETGTWIDEHTIFRNGPHACPLVFTAERPMSVWLGLADGREDDALPVRISDLAISALVRAEEEPPIPLSEIVPPLDRWNLEQAVWDATRTGLESIGSRGQFLLTSPVIYLKAGHDYGFRLDLDAYGDGDVVFGLLDEYHDTWIAGDRTHADGSASCYATYTPDRPCAISLCLADARNSDEAPTRVRNLDFGCFERGPDDRPAHLAKIVPPAHRWKVDWGTWSAEKRSLESVGRPGQNLLTSPEFELFSGHTYRFRLDLGVYGDGDVDFGLIDAKTRNWIATDRTVAYGASTRNQNSLIRRPLTRR